MDWTKKKKKKKIGLNLNFEFKWEPVEYFILKFSWEFATYFYSEITISKIKAKKKKKIFSSDLQFSLKDNIIVFIRRWLVA